jgi:hypothetical protein
MLSQFHKEEKSFNPRWKQKRHQVINRNESTQLESACQPTVVRWVYNSFTWQQDNSVTSLFVLMIFQN